MLCSRNAVLATRIQAAPRKSSLCQRYISLVVPELSHAASSSSTRAACIVWCCMYMHVCGQYCALCRFSKACDAVASIHLGNSAKSRCSEFSPIQCVVLDASQKELRIVLSMQSAEALMSSYLNQSTTSSTSTQDGRQESSGRDGSDENREREGASGVGVRLDVFSKSVVAQRQLACLGNLGEVQDHRNEAEVRSSTLCDFQVFCMPEVNVTARYCTTRTQLLCR